MFFNNDAIVNLLRNEVKPAIGCTEPVAIALAVSRACMEVKGEEIDNIKVELSLNLYKNAMGVTIPGTGRHGVALAAALGAVAGDYSLGLKVLENVTSKDIEKALQWIKQSRVMVYLDSAQTGIFVKASIQTRKNHCVGVILKGSHTNIVSVFKGDIGDEPAQIDFNDNKKNDDNLDEINLKEYTILQLRQLIEEIPFSELEFLIEGIKMNMAVAQAGLEKDVGLGIGKTLYGLQDKENLPHDIIARVRIMTAAAADARMGGTRLPVMSSGGSGNQGIGITITTAIVAEYLKVAPEKLARALALGHLVNLYVKEFSGKVSAVCGCAIGAGISSSAAIAWLLECDDYQIAGAIKNVIANIYGMICDGAKGSCALKVATSSVEAVIAAQLASKNVIIPSSNGIICDTVEETIRKMGEICASMTGTDEKIFRIMAEKENIK